MRSAVRATAAALLLAAAASACAPGQSNAGGPKATPAVPASPSASPGSTPGGGAGSAGGRPTTAILPDLVGKGLQSAQDEAQDAGFHGLTSHDASGRGRLQILDRDWKVCSQAPAPGRASTDASVDLAAVKLAEDCPSGGDDGRTPTAKAGTMPDLIGKSVRVARETLPSDASIDVRDSTGQDRLIIVDTNWKVCHLSPAVGAPLGGKPITIDAVKTDEDC